MSTTLAAWLDGLGLGRYAESFAANDIDLRTLPLLTEADLRELGVTVGHRRILLAAIAALRAGNGDPAPVAARPDGAAAAATPEAERRLLSVLFCDLVGSTELSQHLDPEDMRDLSRRYQDAVAGAVTRYGGHVAKYLGDGILAYFGWPRAYEDQAERAVRAGLEAAAAVGTIPATGDGPLQARVGIATGQVVVGDLIGASGREEGAVAGDTPNLAARLQEAAMPGQVVVADATRRLLGAVFAIEDLGERTLKGFQRRERLFRVVGERPAESRFEAARAGTLAAFVGRSLELGFVLERWTAARAGRGQVVLIGGEAGIGKSRLVRELTEQAAATPHELIRLQGSPYHATSAFHPIIERLSRVAGFAPEDPAAVRLDKLEAMLRQNGEDVAAVAPVYAELLSVPADGRYAPLDLAPQQLRERTTDVLVERLVRLGSRSPVLMVVEDAHWIDPTTCEVLEHAAARIADLPVMLALTHRPEWSVDWAESYGHCSRLQLGRLERHQIAELAQAICGEELSDVLVDHIAARTDGVPLFVEEVTRSLLERGLAASADAAAIPATLQGSLMARLDRLPPSAKRIAHIASVIGRDFDDELLRRTAGLDQDALDEALAQLGRAQLVVRSALRRAAHMFRHALIRDAAYQLLLTRTRRDYHRRIAEVLVADHPEIAATQPELIARHFAEAGMPAAALPFWQRAAARALARSANFEAVDHCERALSCAAELADGEARARETLAATLTLGHALENAGRLPAAMRNSRAAADMARRLGDDARFVAAAMAYDNALFLSGDVHLDSVALLEEALTRIADTDERLRCQVMSRLARASLVVGNEARGDAYNRQAAELARRVGDELALFNILVNTFMVPPSARSHGEMQDWRAAMDEMLALAERLDQDDARGRALSFDTYISAEFGDRARMDAAIDRLEHLGETRQRMHVQWIARHGRAMQALLEGNFAAAEQHAEAALRLGRHTHGDQVAGVYGIQMFSIRREQNRLAEVAPIIKRLMDDKPGQAAWQPGFALVACDLGYHGSAQRVLDELAARDFVFPLDGKRSTTLAYLAEVCTALQDRSRAERLYELLEPYAQMTITAGVTTVCYGAAGRYLGRLAALLDDWDGAAAHFETALAVNRAMRAWPWLARSQHDYARMLRRRGRSGDVRHAERLAEDALEAASRLGMVALVKEIAGRTH